MKSPKTLVILLLAVTTVGGAILVWQQYQELVELRAAAMQKDERATMQKRIWDLERQNKGLNDRLTASRSGAGDDPANLPMVDGPRRGRGGNNPLQMINAVRNALAKPEVQALMSVAQKGHIDSQYAALFRSWNLSSDQSTKVKALLLERASTMQDVMSSALEQGVNPRTDPQGFQQLVANAQNDTNNSLKAVLGDAGYNQLQTYDQTMPQRNVVNQLQQTLSYTDTPLTPAQAEQLVQVLAANPALPRANPGAIVVQSSSGSAGGGASQVVVTAAAGDGGGALGAMFAGALGGLAGGGGAALVGGGAATITPAAVAQAQTVLAPSQVAALQSLQQQQQTQQQLQQVMRDTLIGQIPNIGNPPTPANPGNGKGGD